MDNRSSSLESNYFIGKYPVNNQVQLEFNNLKNLQLLQVAAWTHTFDKVGKDISNYLNMEKFPLPNRAFTINSITMMRIEPLKWWIIGSDIPLISTEEGTTLDLSHSFTHLEIKGACSTIFLNRFLPIDLREKSFPVNSTASSSIHHVSIKLWRSEKSYNLFIPRGFALSLWEIFLESAAQFGYEIK
tara:strand:- start:1220 stop:1780 length:561 start_codon:yes stop_codon:yes gene_type:complete